MVPNLIEALVAGFVWGLVCWLLAYRQGQLTREWSAIAGGTIFALGVMLGKTVFLLLPATK